MVAVAVDALPSDVSHFGQLLAFGQPEVTAGSDEESALFVALQQGPVVDAEQLPGGDAILVAERKPLGHSVHVAALRERVQAQQLLHASNQ